MPSIRNIAVGCLCAWALALMPSLSLLAQETASSTQETASESPVYELRIYTCEPGKLPALHERFAKHTMRIFEKHGMKNVAYWTPLDEERSQNTLVYLLQHDSREAAQASWKAFGADPEWQAVAKQSAEDHGKILAKPPESTYMAPTDYSPEVQVPAAGQTFELRIYTAAEGKFDNLNARFRDHTDRIFQRHRMHALGYWIPLDKPGSNNTLIYILQTESPEAAKASWEAFFKDTEWQKVHKESEADGPLLSKRPDSSYMQLTDYSPRRSAEESQESGAESDSPQESSK